MLKRILDSKVFLYVTKALPFAVIVTALALLLSGKEVTVEKLLSYCSENYLLTILFFLLLYALKSVSVVFPITVLFIAVGMVYAPVIAIAVNVVGMFITCTIPYLIGYYSDITFVENKIKEYPKLQQSNPWFVSFFLRVVSCLPGDLVSMYLGSRKLPFNKYIIASVAGGLPSAVFTTLVGASITDPSSPMFITSVAMTAMLSVLSFIGYCIYVKRQKSKR